MRTTHFSYASAALSCLLLTGCLSGSPADTSGDAQSSQSSSSVSSIRETHNVTYVGTVEPAGISVYMEGTHRLTLEGGKFILLESSSLDLNGYVGEKVQVFGSLRPTVEAGGMIMRIDRIELLETSSSSTSTGSSISSESSTTSSSSTSSSTSTSSRAPTSSAISSVSSVALTSSSPTATTPELEEQITLMKADDLASGNWTQKYCTGHIEFCIPVHKNWWFKSFGTTTTYLWHVEIGTKDLQNIGEGPISVNLLSGSSPVADGTVRDEGNLTVGYRSWTDGRYFVIKGSSSLHAAIAYITSSLTSYTEEQ